MRRPQNYGYEPVPQNQSDELEIENERLAEDLKNKISNLKSLTIDIGNNLLMYEILKCFESKFVF